MQVVAADRNDLSKQKLRADNLTARSKNGIKQKNALLSAKRFYINVEIKIL